MSRTISPSSRKPYGLALVCRIWRPARATVYRRRLPPRVEPPRRPGPVGPMPDAALLAAIRALLTASRFHGEGHRKVWARLRVAGVRTSKRRVRRRMRENDLLAPSRVGSPRGPRSHDGSITPATVDTMWGTDLTTTITGEGQAAVFVAVDHCSAECVGIHAASRATRFEALEPIRQGVREYFRGFAKGVAPGLAVRHDHGSQYMADAFQNELAFSASKARRRSCARPRETAAPSASSEPSRRISCGCIPSRDDRAASASAAGLPRHLQRHMADRTPRLHRPSSLPAETASPAALAA